METWITELTPLSFLERSADVHPDKVAVVYGPDRWTCGELAQRVQELAAALRAKGVPVAYLLFEGEQHGFRRAENVRRALDAELSFYAQVLGFPLGEGGENIEPVEVENL